MPKQMQHLPALYTGSVFINYFHSVIKFLMITF